MAKIMVTTFADEEDVTDKVNEFLAERDLALSQVHIQFVTSVWYSEHRHNPKDKYRFEAYVTHPV